MRAAYRSWVHGLTIGFLEQLLINLMLTVPPQPAQEREPPRLRRWHQVPEECRLHLEPVLDVPPACRASDLCS